MHMLTFNAVVTLRSSCSDSWAGRALMGIGTPKRYCARAADNSGIVRCGIRRKGWLRKPMPVETCALYAVAERRGHRAVLTRDVMSCVPVGAARTMGPWLKIARPRTAKVTQNHRDRACCNHCIRSVFHSIVDYRTHCLPGPESSRTRLTSARVVPVGRHRRTRRPTRRRMRRRP